MSSQPAHRARHTVEVAAPAGVVYGLLADAPRWPLLLPSCVHVERIDFDGTEENLRLWDLGHGRVRSRLVRRVLRAGERRIEFWRQDAPPPGAPASGTRGDAPAFLGPACGTWSVEPDGAGRCLLTLRQDRPPVSGQGPETLHEEVRAELAALREAAERWDRLDELLLSFEDSAYVAGPPELAYDFLYRIEDWAGLVPHVEHAEATEHQPGVQEAIVHTCAPDTGRTSVSRAVRLCFPAAGRIVHKQTAVPQPLAAHCGEWYLEPDENGVLVVRAHQVMIEESAVEAVLGAGARLVDARRHVREQLGRSSTEILDLARWHAESAVRRLR
ncbi:SRPBCC family protein [Streptomyces sp. NPDC058751]|uniref:SRPBCC family protein n=1 Tax=Streptomyces sp. NPDC058751 TaxID=3346623 RepID=UPI0036A1403C